MKGLCQEEILALLRVECAKKQQLVFLYGSTDVNTGVNLRESVRRRECERELVGLAHQALRSEVAKPIAVKFVATTLRDDVKNTAGRVPILSAKTARFYLNFLDKLKRKVRARSAESRIACVHTIEDEIALWPRRTTNRRIAIASGCIS